MEMNEFIRMFLRMFIQVGPYLVVFVVLGYIIKLQEKKAKEREEEQKKGIIKTHYVVKTEKILAIMFVVGTIFFACCMAMGIAQQEDTFVVCVFGFFFLVGIVGTFTIDGGVDKSEFMDDIERRKIPVKSYYVNQLKKNRK